MKIAKTVFFGQTVSGGSCKNLTGGLARFSNDGCGWDPPSWEILDGKHVPQTKFQYITD